MSGSNVERTVLGGGLPAIKVVTRERRRVIIKGQLIVGWFEHAKLSKHDSSLVALWRAALLLSVLSDAE